MPNGNAKLLSQKEITAILDCTAEIERNLDKLIRAVQARGDNPKAKASSGARRLYCLNQLLSIVVQTRRIAEELNFESPEAVDLFFRRRVGLVDDLSDAGKPGSELSGLKKDGGRSCAGTIQRSNPPLASRFKMTYSRDEILDMIKRSR